MQVLGGGAKKLYKNLKKSALEESPWATKCKEATSNEAWGPTGTQLNELARATAYGPEVFNEIFNVLYARLHEGGTKWRKCHKALIVIEFFLLRGDDHCINPIRIGRFEPRLRELFHFSYQDPETGRDAGASIRQRAKDITELAQDAELLLEKREKALQTRNCVGISSDDNIPPHEHAGAAATSETYTAGRKSFTRKLSAREAKKAGGFEDDWGDGHTMETHLGGSHGGGSGGGGAVPRSFIDSPDIHQVRVNKDARGKITGIEGRKVAQSPPAGAGDAGFFGGQAASWADLDAGGAEKRNNGHEEGPPPPPHQQQQKAVRTPSRRRLGAPPSGGAVASPGEEGALAVERKASSSAAFFDFFDSNVSVEDPEVLQLPRKVTNPFASGATASPKLMTFDSPLASPAPAAAALVPGPGQGPGEEEEGFWQDFEGDDLAGGGAGGAAAGLSTPNSDLLDWTAKIGFDFQKLDLDTSASPYKSLGGGAGAVAVAGAFASGERGAKAMQGPSMKALSAGKKKSAAAPAATAVTSQSTGNAQWEAFG